MLGPDITFAVACYNAGQFLEPAVRSALAQTDVDVEVVIVDDGSQDDSLIRARALAKEDGRVRVFQTPHNGGPALARNVAIEVMRGQWFAVLDSDDLIDVDRSRKMIDAAKRCDADILSDNLIVFGENFDPSPWLNVKHETAYKVGLEKYLSQSVMFGPDPNPGFLKPIIRKSFLDEHDIKYNTELRIGEDDNLIIRLLAKGAAYFILPDAMYKYRKHGSSISHRLSVRDVQMMESAEDEVVRHIGTDIAASSIYKHRRRALRKTLAFVTSVEQLKNRQVFGAIRTMLSCPSSLVLYRMPILALFTRFRKGFN